MPFQQNKCGSAKQKVKKTMFFILLCSHLSLSFHKIRCGSAKQKVKKLCFLFCFALTFHYLCRQKDNQIVAAECAALGLGVVYMLNM